MSFERIVEFRPAFDKRHPDPDKNYGIAALMCKFILKGPGGAVQFVFSTGIYLDSAREHLLTFVHTPREAMDKLKPMAYDLGYHSPVPQWEGQEDWSSCDDCPYTPDGKCYYDGSTLNAEPVLEKLIEGGDEAVWEHLTEYYNFLFQTTESEHPQVTQEAPQ